MPENVGRDIILNNTSPEFGLLSRRRLIRAVKNPMDRCTIVSIFPKEIEEVKYTIEPGKFHILPGTFENPAILVVGSSSWWKDVDVEQPMLEMQRSSIEVAEAVVKDYCNGMIGCNMADSMPGLFFVLGVVTALEIKTKYKNELEKANTKQTTWYKILVRLADSLWARSNGNPLVISDEMRLAARSLNFNDKMWLKDFQTVEKVACKGCGTLKHPDYPVCPICKAVDLSHPEAKNLKFAV
jgi:hypothetical protein